MISYKRMVWLGLALTAAPLAVQAQPARPAAPARAAAPAAPAPQSQRIEFKCPKNGTATETTTASQINDRTNLGPESADPFTCGWKRGFTTGASIYGLYGADASEMKGADIRRGMGELFAGGADVSFRFQSATTAGGQSMFEENWRRVGVETLTTSGAAVPTHVFLRTSVNKNTGNKWVWRYWYDPVSGEWVKRTLVEGNTTTQDYVVSKLPAP